jgi:hypothetical protein
MAAMTWARREAQRAIGERERKRGWRAASRAKSAERSLC